MAAHTVKAGDIEVFLQEKTGVLAPKSINHLRGYVSRIYNAARAAGRYDGDNPAKGVAKRRVPRGLPTYLREDEVLPVLDAIPWRWQPLFATAIYTGMRKGELLGLLKSHVDLEGRKVAVARSYDRNTTKGGHADVIPLAKEVVPYLAEAMRRARGTLVFPDESGAMLSRHTPLEDVLRRALARAGVVEHFEHRCRKRGCGHQETASDPGLRRCPRHGDKLWPVPIVRKIRFHDLRHTTASLLMMRGANPAAVQRILRHTDPKVTTEVYGHLSPGYMQSEIDRLAFEPPRQAEVEDAAEAIAGGADAFTTRLLPEAEIDSGNFVGAVENVAGNHEEKVVGVKGFEPSASWSRRERPPRPTRRSGSQGVGIVAGSVGGSVQPSQPSAPDTRSFATHLLPASGPAVCGVVAISLLTVARAAALLGVSAATVYKLCDRGELPHARVSNSIRIAESDLEALLRRRRAGGP
jgi:integrase